jgi:hypothetical protein
MAPYSALEWRRGNLQPLCPGAQCGGGGRPCGDARVVAISNFPMAALGCG